MNRIGVKLEFKTIPLKKKNLEEGDLLLRHIWKGADNECLSWWQYKKTEGEGNNSIIHTLHSSFRDTASVFKAHKMFILSDEKIRVGDKVLVGSNIYTAVKDSGTIGYITPDDVAFLYFKPSHKKILATNIEGLDIPIIPDDFLRYFCCVNGNIGKGITNALYEKVVTVTKGTNEFDFYEEDVTMVGILHDGQFYQLFEKEKAYTKAEVLDLIEDFVMSTYHIPLNKHPERDEAISNWINKNL